MNIIIITLPDFIENEIDIIHQMFDCGLQFLHIRKPQSSVAQLSHFIEQIDSQYYNRITLHDHHQLAEQYHLGGIHLNSRNPQPLPNWQGRISRSCHSFSELTSQPYRIDYQFLSPIFNSISKQGYQSAFTHKQLIQAVEQNIINPQVYALGGVTLSKLPYLKTLHFHGAALLGEPWHIAIDTKSLFERYMFDLLYIK